jgi:hypothetical protein
LKAISTDGGPDNDVNTENGVLPGAGGSLVTTVNFGYNNLADCERQLLRGGFEPAADHYGAWHSRQRLGSG